MFVQCPYNLAWRSSYFEREGNAVAEGGEAHMEDRVEPGLPDRAV
jgi:hypothetical protein